MNLYRGLLAAALVVALPSLAHAQRTPLYQNGTLIANDLLKGASNGIAVAVGGLNGDINGRGANPFSIVTGNAPGLQFNRVPTTGAYNYFSFGYNAAGEPVTNIDGTEYPLPGGTGVATPATTTVNELALWNNTTGTLLKNGLGINAYHADTQTGTISSGTSPFTVHSNSASAISHACIWSAVNRATVDCQFTPSHPSPGYDGFRSVVISGPGTDAIWTSGFSSYVLNNTARNIGSSDANGTSYNFIGEMVVDPVGESDFATSWNINTLCSDNYGQVVTSSTNRSCFGWEHDVNITSPNTGAIGIMLGGNSIVQPVLNANGIGLRGINLNRVDGYPGTGNVAKWQSFLSTSDGATATFSEINAISPVAIFTGTIAGTVLTVSAVSVGIIGVDPFGNTTLNGAGVTAATRILTQVRPLIGGEGMGGIGRYTVSISQTVGPVAMNTSSSSQASVTKAYNSSSTSIQTIEQLSSLGDHIFNVPFPGNFTIWSGGQQIAGFARTLVSLSAGVGIVAPGLNTVAVVAGSLCAAADGTFIYKVGANCF